INWWQPKVLKKQRVAFCLMRAGVPANGPEKYTLENPCPLSFSNPTKLLLYPDQSPTPLDRMPT
ncbi:hypothetical protein, partial [Pseudomonas asiatica]|uniref:hypothetical protein n=1 Tax=Pseudomonas asiatica TaxID=2219225 RepID=UPI00345AF531